MILCPGIILSLVAASHITQDISEAMARLESFDRSF